MIQVVIAFIVGLVLGLLIAWFYWQQRISEQAAGVALQAAAASRSAESQVPVAKPDDLKRIEGIGPKTSQVLQNAGITTFAQLETTEVSRLEKILLDASLTLADPSTWPEQARLAVAGDWEALNVLQDELSGGRRV